MGSAPKPSTAKGSPSSLDDEPLMPPAKPASPSILSTGLSRAIVISTVLLVAAIATPLVVTHRYITTAGMRGDTPVVYRLDTLTGKLTFCTPLQCGPVSDKGD